MALRLVVLQDYAWTPSACYTGQKWLAYCSITPTSTLTT